MCSGGNFGYNKASPCIYFTLSQASFSIESLYRSDELFIMTAPKLDSNCFKWKRHPTTFRSIFKHTRPFELYHSRKREFSWVWKIQRIFFSSKDKILIHLRATYGWLVKVILQPIKNLLDRSLIIRRKVFLLSISHSKTSKDTNHQLLQYILHVQRVRNWYQFFNYTSFTTLFEYLQEVLSSQSNAKLGRKISILIGKME